MNPTWRHLARRFFSVAVARALSDDERNRVGAWIPEPDVQSLFWSQPKADQRHGLDAAAAVEQAHADRRDLVRAALLHDIGKQDSRLGIVGRSVAGGLAKLGVHPPGRLQLYTSHGPRGADALERLGVEDLVVLYTRHHHGRRPPGVDEEDWALLVDVDRRH